MLVKILLFIALIHPFISFGGIEEKIIQSIHLDRNDTIIIITPNDYSQEKNYPLVYLLHGFSEKYNQWTNNSDLEKLSDKYQFIFVCPDGFKSWYIDSPVLVNSNFKQFFYNELKPFIHRAYSVDKDQIFISGLSMGGYGAFQLFAENPSYFKSFGSTSGAIDFNDDFNYSSYLFFNSDYMIKEVEKIIGGRNNWQLYSVYRVINKIINTNKPFIIDCGYQDPFYNMNTKLNQYLVSKKANATFISSPGGHNNEYWGNSILSHLEFYKRLVNKSMK